jgi:hypothetical protein
MSMISTAIDVVAGLTMAIGGVLTLNETYRRVAARKTVGKVVAWEPATDSQGLPTKGSYPRFAFTVGDRTVEERSNSTGYDEDVAAHPVGSSAPIRYLKGEVPEFIPSVLGSLVYPLIAVVVGLGLFVLATKIG